MRPANTMRVAAFIAVLFATVVAAPGIARACTLPDGVEGELIYSSDHKVVQYCDGTNWIRLGSTLDTRIGSLAANKWCAVNAGGTAIDCTQDAPANANDPRIGTLSNGKWCSSDGSGLSCTEDAPIFIAPGSDKQLIFNDGGSVLAGSAQLFWDKANNRLGIGTSTPQSALDIEVAGLGGALRLRSGHIVTTNPNGGLVLNAGPPSSLNGGIFLRSNSTLGSPDTFTDLMYVSAEGNVGIGTVEMEESALLDLSSVSRGFLPPRMTTAQRNAIVSAVAGLTIYNTTNSQLEYYNGAAWVGYTNLGRGFLHNNAAITTSSTSWVDMPSTSGTFTSNGFPALFIVTIPTWHNTVSGVGYYRLLIDGVQEAVTVLQFPGSNFVQQATMLVQKELTPGTHTYAVQWYTTSGSLGASWGNAHRSVSIHEIGVGGGTGGGGGGSSLWTANGNDIHYNTGRVGIGTSTPGHALDIAGNVGRISGASFASWSMTATGTNGREYRVGATDDANGLGGGKFTVYDQTSGDARLVIDAAGNVGIGTSSPVHPLDVHGVIRSGGGPGLSGGLIIPNEVGNPTFHVITNQGQGWHSALVNNWGAPSNPGVLLGTTRPDGMALQVQSSIPVTSGALSGYGTSLLTVTGDGRVGINRNDPGYKLDVVGSTGSAAQNGVRVTVGSNGTMGFGNTIFLHNSDSTVGNVTGVMGSNAGGHATGGIEFININHGSTNLRAGQVTLFTLGAGENLHRFLMNEFGNVSIGHISPNVKLDVAGAIVSRAHDAGAGTSINFALSNTAYTTASCGAMTLSNMQDGGSYTLAVKGGTSGTCAFTHSGLTFKYPTGHGATTAGKHTVYTFIRAGTDVYVSWIPGY